MHILVQVNSNDNGDHAIRSLKQKMQRELVFSKMRISGFFESCSEKKTRKRQEAAKRRRYKKLARR